MCFEASQTFQADPSSDIAIRLSWGEFYELYEPEFLRPQSG